MRMLSSSSIVGTDVRNEANETLGDIKDLMIHPETGSIEYAVLSFGGLIGIGEKLFAIPFKAFSIDRNNEEFVLDIPKEKLENAPGFDKDNWPSNANSEYLKSVNNYYTENAMAY